MYVIVYLKILLFNLGMMFGGNSSSFFFWMR
uniref:Uncharacterized protein n=1 Tax=Anguilla anguilla TaxID=7936 RepID=A0A0E9WAZ3_ANGAN